MKMLIFSIICFAFLFFVVAGVTQSVINAFRQPEGDGE